MANKLDPHRLVALMCHVFEEEQDGSPRSLDLRSINPQYGITSKRDTSIRTFPILDALASLSISAEKSQVVAVSLQLDSKKREIRLIVAENRKVDSHVVGHLNSVWRILQTEFAVGRGSDVNEEGSSNVPEEVALPLRVSLFRKVYRYSLKKQLKLAGKWWSDLLNFTKELATRRGKRLQGPESSLYEVVAALDSVLKLARKLRGGQELTDDEWKVLHEESMWADEQARLVLAEQGDLSCESLAQQFNNTPDRPHLAFRLRRALEKLTSLTRHVECLISFANSPRLRPVLQYDMHIDTISGQTRFVQLPTTKKGWKTFLKDAARKPLPWQEDDAQELVEKYSKGGYSCPAHCECALIQYLATKHDDPWDDIPAFSYIGVSKLSCAACRVWLESFNEVSPREFYTRGSHRKWYWPWAMPKAMTRVGEEALRETMAEKVSLEYIQSLQTSGRYRSDSSDSTVASFRGGKHQLSGAQIKYIRSRHAQQEQESGGTIVLHLDSMTDN